MSVERETIAEYYHVEPDEIRCDRCQYGAGPVSITTKKEISVNKDTLFL